MAANIFFNGSAFNIYIWMSSTTNSEISLMVISLPVMIITTIVTCLLRYRLAQHNSKDSKTWPIIGSHWEMSTNFHRLHDWMMQYFSEDHQAIKTKVFSKCSYATVNPANVEYILKTNFKNYPKGEEARYRLHDLLGDGILNSDGERWRKQRKVASLHFSVRNSREYNLNAFRKSAVKLITALNEATRSSGKVDIHDLLMRTTLDSICKIGFGVELGCFSPSLPGISFATAFDSINEITSRRFLNPFWRTERFLNIGSEKVLLQSVKEIERFTSQVIHRRRPESLDRKEEIKNDLLWRLMSSEANQGGLYNDKELRDAILNFLIAGRDTTALTLAWFIYSICKNPEKTKPVIQEVQQVLGLYKCNLDHTRFEHVANLLTYDSLNKMQYLHAALTETLRLYPAVPRDGKVAYEDDILPDGTRVMKGEQVAYIPYSMGRMEFLWGKDAHEFKPERWLRDGVFQPESPYKFTAFQAGPRICLGKDSAYLQMKMTAALLMYFFRFSLVNPENPVHYRVMQVLSMANGLHVFVSSPHSEE